MMINLVKERLQHLELRRCGDNAVHSVASLPRSLETVFLVDPNWEAQTYAHNGQIPAKKLTFQRVSSWCAEDLAHLSQYQNLTELRLVGSLIDVDGPLVVRAFQNLTMGEYTRHSVLLPSVTALYIRGPIPFRILDPLNLPALTMLEVRNHDALQPLSIVHSTTMHHTITKLAVRFTPETADGWSDALVAVLAGASNLQPLVVSSWMEQHLSVSEIVEIELV